MQFSQNRSERDPEPLLKKHMKFLRKTKTMISVTTQYLTWFKRYFQCSKNVSFISITILHRSELIKNITEKTNEYLELMTKPIG